MKYSVLIVDDEKIFRDYIRNMSFWSSSNFAIEGEANGTKEALRLLEEKQFDVVIFDVSMPGDNGVVLSKKIANEYPFVSMVAVSSYDAYDYVHEILKNGAHDYILKGRLTEELLKKVLSNVKLKIQNTSAWEGKKKLRLQVSNWMFQDGFYPFTSDNSRKMAMIVWITQKDNYDKHTYETMIEGMERIFEAEFNQGMDVLSLNDQKNNLVLLLRFYDETSEHNIKMRAQQMQSVAVEKIQSVYGVSLKVEKCPVFFNDNAMRSFVLHKLEADEKKNQGEEQLSMTISQQKKVILAIENRDIEEIDRVIHQIYESIPLQQPGVFIVATRELIELIKKTAIEYHISLDFLPEDNFIFKYMREYSREHIICNLIGVYKNVIREIKEKEIDKKYTEIVAAAIEYMMNNFYRQISLNEIADTIGVNSSYLSRIFHKETGITVTDYLNTIRINEAKAMLQEGIPLKEVTGRCGFRSYSYFMKIFKEYTKTTPKNYLDSL